jgi:uncharacterized membrane protein YhiD involved in acid resistance
VINFEQSFLSTLVLLPPIVTLVMQFIRGDLVLSLGLVGSLSIIRFRTPIKDTRDMAYLFWVIAVGLGCGTDNWTMAIIATLILAVGIVLLYLMEYGRPVHSDFVLVISGHGEYPVREVEGLIRKYSLTARTRSQETKGRDWEMIYEMRMSKSQERDSHRFIETIRNVDGIDRVSLLAPQLALPM